ncbi:uncharacterized protein LOC141499450 [Macrotis lagotis]|uniref:uncharacterized protein LOC141499450 n=1 Tax=Macrotis lagotis TaxID=92651 RepID=UPI003D685BAE
MTPETQRTEGEKMILPNLSAALQDEFLTLAKRAMDFKLRGHLSLHQLLLTMLPPKHGSPPQCALIPTPPDSFMMHLSSLFSLPVVEPWVSPQSHQKDKQPHCVMKILNPLEFFLSSYFMTFFILMMPKMTSGKFSVIGPAGPIRVSLGEEAELPCYLFPPQSAQDMEVVWLQSTWVVHLYQDGEDKFGDQAPHYQGRTELVKDAITSGNVTLKIQNVRYTCLIEDGFYQEEADMELKILGKGLESLTTLPEISKLNLGFGVPAYALWALFILKLRVCYFRSVPFLWEINGILTVTFALEMEMILYAQWMWHRCRGFRPIKDFFTPTDWKDFISSGAFSMLAVLRCAVLYKASG